MTTKHHIDPAALAAIDPADPANADKVRTLLATALVSGDSVSAALGLLLGAIALLAEHTDDPALVLVLASTMIDGMIEDVGLDGDPRDELRQPDADGNGDPT